MGTLVPNFFIVYFGQDVPHGSITDDEVMLKLTKMGEGYKLWAESVKDASDKSDNIAVIIDKIDDEDNPGWIKKYLDPNRND